MTAGFSAGPKMISVRNRPPSNEMRAKEAALMLMQFPLHNCIGTLLLGHAPAEAKIHCLEIQAPKNRCRTVFCDP